MMPFSEAFFHPLNAKLSLLTTATYRAFFSFGASDLSEPFYNRVFVPPLASIGASSEKLLYIRWPLQKYLYYIMN